MSPETAKKFPYLNVMKICLICVEIFAWGKYGGFGRVTRIIGHELVKRGERGYKYVRDTFETNIAIDQHISVYN